MALFNAAACYVKVAVISVAGYKICLRENALRIRKLFVVIVVKGGNWIKNPKFRRNKLLLMTYMALDFALKYSFLTSFIDLFNEIKEGKTFLKNYSGKKKHLT